MVQDGSHRVAVYGTLKRGQSNHHILAGARFLGRDRMQALRLFDLGPYPAVVQVPVSGRSAGVLVEIYAVNERQLTRVDQLEDHRPEAPGKGLYQRELFPTRHGNAWVYLYNRPIQGQPLIRSGCWKQRSLNRH